MNKYVIKRFSNSESDDKKLEREKSKLAELEDRQKSGKKKLVKSSIKRSVAGAALGGLLGSLRGVGKSEIDFQSKQKDVLNRVNEMSPEDRAKLANTDPMTLGAGFRKLHEPTSKKIIRNETIKGAAKDAVITAGVTAAVGGYKLYKNKKAIEAQKKKVKELEENSKGSK